MEKQEKQICIILKSPKDPDQVGFLIDSPGDVIEIDQQACEVIPANMGETESEYIESVIKLEDDLLMVIDSKKIFSPI